MCADLAPPRYDALHAALSDIEITKKRGKCIVKAQWLDWISRQLDFVFASGVEIKLKPSADNIYDGDSRDIMGKQPTLQTLQMHLRIEGSG